MAHQQRPPPRTRSSTALSSSTSSSAFGSPGASISVRGMSSTTPDALTARNLPRPGYMSKNSSSSSINDGPSTSRPSRPGHARDRSTSNFSVATSSASTRAPGHHNRRQQTLMGGNPNSRLSRSHLATYDSSTAMNRSNTGMTSPPVPDILINGAERPGDVDIGSIGRLPSLSAASPVRSSPEATSVGVDGLFAKFGVKEVRSIAQRGRAKAESKREELRTMVGERYRDLLGAADSIVRMRKSSSVLLDRLERARHECDREAMLSKAAEEDMTRSHMLSRAATPLVSGHTPYSVATLVKLLLDCPEHIWRCIERQDFLSAARLDSIGRAVYRELVSAGKRKATPKPRRRSAVSEEDGEDSGGYDSDEEDDEAGELLAAFPLVEQQFDTLDGLAPQITSRASLHLRAWDVPVSKVADSLATLVMLDRISMSDGLDLLLDQRSKTLAALFQDPASPSTPSMRRPSAMPTASNLSAISMSTSVSQSGEGKAMHDAIQRTTEALALILVTHEHVARCFGVGADGQESRLLHLLRLLQESTALRAESPNTTLSMVQAQPAGSSKQSTDSLQPILATLSNAHLFLRYLPEQILTFTPYIDIDSAESELSAENVQNKLDAWFESALHTFEAGVGRLVNALGSAAQLADARRIIRESVARRASDNSTTVTKHIASLNDALDTALGQRFVEIYSIKLENITKAVSGALNGALRALPSSAEDLQPDDFLFSASLPFPSSSIFPTTSTTVSSGNKLGRAIAADPFTLFKQAIQERILGRSPVLSECLQQLESTAAETKLDILAWLDDTKDSRAREAYTAAARQSLSSLEQILRDSLQGQARVAEQLFIGSIAAHLAMDSSFVQALLLLQENQDLPHQDKDRLLDVEKASKQKWRKSNVEKAADYLRTSLLDQLDFPSSDHPSRPAGCVLDSLSILVDAAHQLGIHRTYAIPTGITNLLEDYQTSLLSTVFDDGLLERVKSVGKSQRAKYVQQLRSNIALLRQVLAAGLGNPEDDQYAEQWTLLEDRLRELAEDGPVGDRKSRDTFLRTQNLLAPLLASSRASLLQQASDLPTSLLLPFGIPPSATASEGMLDLAKPGPRLALLPVNATAA